MRNGNKVNECRNGNWYVYSSYRTYEEWKRGRLIQVIVVPLVLTVPMRNGNLITNEIPVTVIIRSYRTYEEWKRGARLFCFRGLTVLTVPMRNGN